MEKSSGPAEGWPKLCSQFKLLGEIESARPYGSGHINDTFKAEIDQAGTRVPYIFQRINQKVFKDPKGLMENVQRVTTHQRRRCFAEELPEPSRRCLTVVPTFMDHPCLKDSVGDFWRCYLFVEKARTYDLLENLGQAFEAAKAFGRFQALLVDLPGGPLTATIPRFHDTPWRFQSLEDAVRNDPQGRKAGCARELEDAFKLKALACGLAKAGLPERATHNDTKLNNVMLDDATGEGICVIDLDTVMPGLAAHDFGDLARSATAAAPEDEADLAKVGFRMDVFEALAKGFMAGAGAALQAAEVKSLALGSLAMTCEVGVRFLTDYLEGDLYFKTKRPGHNLDRCRTQLKMAQEMEKRLGEMEKLVLALAPGK